MLSTNLFNNDKNTFNFDELQLQYDKDPRYIYIEETFKSLIVSIMKHLDISKRLVKQQNLDGYMDDMNAGNIYNGYMIKNIQTSKSYLDEITNDELFSVSAVFKQSIEKSSHLKIFALNNSNPIDCMFSICKYLFIPIRLNTDTFPEQIKINSLKKWITLCLTLPFNEIYTSRYDNSINNIPFLHEAVSKMFDSDIIIKKIIEISPDFIIKTIARNKTQNTSQHFIRLVGHIIVVMSIEILKCYCPNIYECKRINPNYNGKFINPFDGMVNNQTAAINDLIENLSTISNQ